VCLRKNVVPPVAVILNWGGEGRGVVWQSLNSWLGFAQQQKLTFGKLLIVLFVGQHFSGSLFELIHLSILTRERTKET